MSLHQTVSPTPDFQGAFCRSACHSHPMNMLISEIAQKLANGELSARDHLEKRLAAIDTEDGKRAFITVNAAEARAAADAIDSQRKEGRALPAFAGVTLSVKDLFDVRGEVTRAGSRVLDEAAPATMMPRLWHACVPPGSSLSAAQT